jgi:hypothetical protein
VPRGRLGGRAHRPPRPHRVARRHTRDRASRAAPPRRAAVLHRPRRPPLLASLTDLPGDPVELECLHRARASAEDRVRTGKQTGLENLPFRDFDHNQVWVELSLIAQDLIAWTQALALDGELASCEPKTLRYRLLHTAARLAFHARRASLRLQRAWPWATALATAFARLTALPPPAR